MNDNKSLVLLAAASAAASALAFGVAAPALADPTAVGVWRDNEKGSVIRVYECGGAICARVVTPYQPGAKDVYNPDPALRERPITGLVIMDKAKKSAGNSWSGTLYNAEDGKSYSGSMIMVSGDELQMKGCAFGIFCQTRGFARVK
jgi:uncharacterized protein (DUF2147 family)